MRNQFIQAVKKYFFSYQGIPTECWIMITFTLLNAVAVGICFFLSLYFVTTLNFSMFMVGFLMSSYGMGTVVGGLVSGKMCDLFSLRKIIIFSLFLQCLSFFLLTKIHVFNLLIIVLFLLGFSNYCFKTVNNFCLLKSSS